MFETDHPEDRGLIEEVGRRVYAHVPEAFRLWSVVNRVYLLRSDGQPDRILKVDGRDGEEVRREQRVLTSLRELGLCVPAVELTQDHCPPLGASFTLMPRVGRQNLGEQFHADRRAPAIRRLFEEAGRTLAVLGDLPAVRVPGALDAAAAARKDLRHWARIRDQCVGRGVLSAPVAAVLESAHRMLQEPREVFVHGDFHPHNVVVTADERLCIIDWGNAALGWGLCDLGRCLAAVRTWFGLEDALLRGYESVHPLDAAQRQPLASWRDYALVEFAALSGLDPASHLAASHF